MLCIEKASACSTRAARRLSPSPPLHRLSRSDYVLRLVLLVKQCGSRQSLWVLTHLFASRAPRVHCGRDVQPGRFNTTKSQLAWRTIGGRVAQQYVVWEWRLIIVAQRVEESLPNWLLDGVWHARSICCNVLMHRPGNSQLQREM